MLPRIPTGRRRRVVAHLKRVVEHPDPDAHGRSEAIPIDLAFAYVTREVHRAERGDTDTVGGRVYDDFGAEVCAGHCTYMVLRRADVAGILERHPRVAGLE